MAKLNEHRGKDILNQSAVVSAAGINAFDLLVSSFLINILGLAVPLTLMQIYDRIIPNKALGSLGWLVLACSVAIILEAVLRFCRDQISSWLGARYEYALNCCVIKRLLYADLEQLEEINLASHIDRLKAGSVLRSFYCNQFFMHILDLPFVVFYIWVIWVLNVGMAKAVIFIMVGVFIVTAIMKPLYGRAKRRQVSAIQDKQNFLIEVISRMHFVKAFAHEEHLLRKYEKFQEEENNSDFLASVSANVPGNVGVLVSQLTLFAVIWIGATPVIEGSLTLGVLTACMMLGVRAVQPTLGISTYWYKTSDAKIAKEKLSKYFEFKGADPGKALMERDEIRGGINIDSVYFKYKASGKYLLEDLSLQIGAGEMIGVSASSSIGASELLNIICGLRRPEKGRVIIDEFDLRLWDENDLSGKIEYIPVKSTLLKGTVLENIAVFDKGLFHVALDTAAMLRLDSRIAQLPQGYNTLLNRESHLLLPTSTIQMIALARALVARPKILLFDRTDAALDDEAKEVFAEVVTRLKNHSTIVLVSDNEHLLKQANRIIRIDAGKVVPINRFNLLPSSRDTYAQVWVA